jgi:hypothetical protein
MQRVVVQVRSHQATVWSISDTNSRLDQVLRSFNKGHDLPLGAAYTFFCLQDLRRAFGLPE